MPSHPIATWITPCNSRNVQVLGTRTRRHTIGLIPSSQTLTCTISAASVSAADEAVSTTDLVRFGARVTRPAYRRSPLAVAGTPDILMLSLRSVEGGLDDVRDVLPGRCSFSTSSISSSLLRRSRSERPMPTRNQLVPSRARRPRILPVLADLQNRPKPRG